MARHDRPPISVTPVPPLKKLMRRLGLNKRPVDRQFSTSDLDTTAYRLIAEHVSDCISVHTDGGAYVFVSPSCERLFGWTADQVAGKPVTDFVHPKDVAPVGRYYSTDEDIEHDASLIYRLRCADGGYRWVETRSKQFLSDDGFPKIVSTTRDVSELRKANDQLKVLNAQLAKIATRDSLTGLFNRRRFGERLAQLIREARRGRQFVLALIDIDHFKSFNDNFGHKAGDDILKGVANSLVSSCREVDFVARYGGDEFTVLYVDLDTAQAMRLADQQRYAIATMSFPYGPVTVSIGISAYSPEVCAAESLLHEADSALYRAKRGGRDRVALARGAV